MQSRSRLRGLRAAAILLLASLAVVACGSTAGSPAGVGSTASASAPASASAAVQPSASGGPTAATPGDGSAPDCSATPALTPSQTEGPYFKAGSPERSSLVEVGMSGTRLTLTGFVVTTACTPVAGATVDIWQADASGAYDNSGYRLRGHVLTDSTGRFTFETIVPGEYPGRTEHIHVKVTPAGGATLTTQLYFPGTAANDSDGIFSPVLLLDVTPVEGGVVGRYTFVVAGS